MKKVIYLLLVIFLIGCSNKKEHANSINTNNNDSSKNKPAIIQNIELENQINIQEQETVPKPGHTGRVTSVVFSSEGKQIISSSYDDKYIRIWDVATGQEIKTILADDKGINLLKLSPDEKYIVSVSYSDTIIIRDKNTGKELRRIKEFTEDDVKSMEISPDGNKIAVVYHNHTSPGYEDTLRIRLFDITTCKQIPTSLGYLEKVTLIAFNPDGSLIITGSFDNGEIKIWDTAKDQELRNISEDLYRVDFISFSPEGKYIISRSDVGLNRYITIWDANTGIKIKNISIYLNSLPIAISPDGNMIATNYYKSDIIYLINVNTGRDINTISGFSGHTNTIYCLAFSPDGKMIVSGSADKSIKLWDVATGKEIRTMGK